MSLPEPPNATQKQRAGIEIVNMWMRINREISDERGLSRFCTSAACRRARRCIGEDPRPCFRAYAKKTGDRSAWEEWRRRTAALDGSAEMK